MRGAESQFWRRGGKRVGVGIRGVAITRVQAGRLPHQARVLTVTTGRERRRLRTYRRAARPAPLPAGRLISSTGCPVPTGRGVVRLGLPSSARAASGPSDRGGTASPHLTWLRAGAIVVPGGKGNGVGAAGATAPFTVLTLGCNARWCSRDPSLPRLVPAPRVPGAARRSTATGRRRTCPAYASGHGRSRPRESRNEEGRRDDTSAWALAGGSQGSAEARSPAGAGSARSPPLCP
jgi:hypothetical protein